MFSDRIAHDLTRNRLAQAVEAMRAAQKPYIDLTESNPTRAGFHYPSDLLQPLAQPRALTYEPSPLGALGAREAISREYARQQIDVAPDRIVLTASTSEAYSILFKLLAGAGDEVLVRRTAQDARRAASTRSRSRSAVCRSHSGCRRSSLAGWP